MRERQWGETDRKRGRDRLKTRDMYVQRDRMRGVVKETEIDRKRQRQKNKERNKERKGKRNGERKRMRKSERENERDREKERKREREKQRKIEGETESREIERVSKVVKYLFVFDCHIRYEWRV